MKGYNLTISGDGGDTFSCQTPKRKAEIRFENSKRMSKTRPVDSKWINQEARDTHSEIIKQKHADPIVGAKYQAARQLCHTDEEIQKKKTTMSKLGLILKLKNRGQRQFVIA